MRRNAREQLLLDEQMSLEQHERRIMTTREQPFDAIPKFLCNDVGHDVAVRLAQRMSQEQGRVNGPRIGNKPDRAPPHCLSPLVELKASNTEFKSCLISSQSPDGD